MTARPWELRHGDVIEKLAAEPDCSFDAVLCDPPYGLRMLGKKWDISVPSVDLWRAVYRVMKPGAPLVAFGGTRTYHRMVVAIEDAGFQPRDMLCWLYGSAMPKSRNVSKDLDAAAGATKARKIVGSYKATGTAARRTASGGVASFVPSAADGASSVDPNARVYQTTGATPLARQWDGYGTGLKPAHEPAVLARRPLEGKIVANVTKWGVGALAIDACRIGTGDALVRPQGQPVNCLGARSSRGRTDEPTGRWPANLLLDAEAGAMLDAASGERPGMSGGGVHRDGYAGGMFGAIDSASTARGDGGGASRFFYSAKVSTEERDRGLRGLRKTSPGKIHGRAEGSAGLKNGRAGAARGRSVSNDHPTLKPVDLCRYLARLLRPPVPGRILVPFAGSGSEMIGCVLEGWPDVVGIEREESYVAIARRRLRLAEKNPRAFEPFAERKGIPFDERQIDMFVDAED